SECGCSPFSSAPKNQKRVEKETRKLLDALAKCTLTGAIKAIRNGADPNACDHRFCPALVFAATCQNLEIVQELLRQPTIIVDATNPDRCCTALQAAIVPGNILIVQALLDAKAASNPTNRNSRTPLEYAAEGNHNAVVRILIQADADPNTVDHRGITVLCAAAELGFDQVIRTLIDSKADPNKVSEYNPASLHGNKMNVVDLSRHYCTPILMAASKGRWDIVDLLLESRADPSIAQIGGQNDRRTVIDLARDRAQAMGLGDWSALMEQKFQRALPARPGAPKVLEADEDEPPPYSAE
ncbi:MAG: ankyrin repeat domain-containing protein, partial [Minisyncoccia bacterium]